MNIWALLDEPTSLRVLTVLGHFLWQAAAVAAALMVGLRLLRSATAGARYAVLLGALAAMAACPVVTAIVMPRSVGQTFLSVPGERRTPVSGQARMPVPPSPEAGAALAAGGNGSGGSAAEAARTLAAGQARMPVPPRRGAPATGLPEARASALAESGWMESAAPWAVAAYLLGVLLMLGRVGAILVGGQRLRRASSRVDDPKILAALSRAARAMGMAFTPAVAFCRRVGVPAVVGVLRPMILLPLALGSGLSAAQIEMVLAHELAHIRRWDGLVNLLQRLIEAALFFHPAVWWVSRRIRIEREHCCDDLVLRAGGEPLDYADTLVRMAARAVAPVPAGALGATGRPSQLRGRILRMFGQSGHEQWRLGRLGAAVVSLLLAAGIIAPIVLKAQAGDATPSATQPATAPRAGGQWHSIGGSQFASIEVERKLYEAASTEHFLIHVRITNTTDRAIGADLRDYWNVIYPNQWSMSTKDHRQVIDERRMVRIALGQEQRRELIEALGAGRLARIEPGKSIDYYREFNAGSRRDVEKQADKFMLISLDGEQRLTDGKIAEQNALDWDRKEIDTQLVIPAPVHWAQVGEGATIVDRNATTRPAAREEPATDEPQKTVLTTRVHECELRLEQTFDGPVVTKAVWLLRRPNNPREPDTILRGKVEYEMGEVRQMAASPDVKRLAIVSVGEGHPVLDIVDLSALLAGKDAKSFVSVNPYPSWIDIERWEGERLIVKSDVLLTHRNAEGRVPAYASFHEAQQFAVDSAGKITALSADAKDAVAYFREHIRHLDAFTSEAAWALVDLKAIEAVDDLKRAAAMAKPNDLKADLTEAAARLALLKDAATRPATTAAALRRERAVYLAARRLISW
jgi:beta-lactamase regulating signal transducer with metallopeptidase domain